MRQVLSLGNLVTALRSESTNSFSTDVHAACEDRNLETELADARAHPIDGSVIFPRVPGVEDQLVGGPDLDLKGRRCDHAPRIAVADFSQQSAMFSSLGTSWLEAGSLDKRV